MHILIPTYRRTDDQKTWHTIHPDLRQHITFVVRPDEADYFRQHYQPSKVEVLPKRYCTGLPGVMQYLLDRTDEPFIYADDDLIALSELLRFKEHLDWDEEGRVRQALWAANPLREAEDQARLFTALLNAVQEPLVAMASPHPVYVPKLARLISYPQFRRHGQLCTQFAAVNPALVKKHGIRWDDGDGNPISDGVFNCKLLHAGLDSMWLSRFTHACAPMFAQGGIDSSEGRARKQNMVQAHLDLLQRYPGLVKARKPKDGKFARFGGKHKKERDYFDCPVTFYRVDYLKKRREELGYPALEDGCRVPADFYLYEETCEDWREECTS